MWILFAQVHSQWKCLWKSWIDALKEFKYRRKGTKDYILTAESGLFLYWTFFLVYSHWVSRGPQVCKEENIIIIQKFLLTFCMEGKNEASHFEFRMKNYYFDSLFPKAHISPGRAILGFKFLNRRFLQVSSYNSNSWFPTWSVLGPWVNKRQKLPIKFLNFTLTDLSLSKKLEMILRILEHKDKDIFGTKWC